MKDGLEVYLSKVGDWTLGSLERRGMLLVIVIPLLLDNERSGRWCPVRWSISTRPTNSFRGFRARCFSKPMFLVSTRARTAPMFTLYCPGWKYVSRDFGLATEIFAKSQLGFLVSCEQARSPSRTPAVKEFTLYTIPADLTRSGLGQVLERSHSGARGLAFSGVRSRSSTLTACFTRRSWAALFSFKLLPASRRPKSPPGPAFCSRGWQRSSFGR
mmetsp:Transcript_53916/g.172871  ORF Transcript_53916/g.172871 Transcript_53916/m.172871 type:complete len:215 (+) Transcript_53916:582-1226(+)